MPMMQTTMQGAGGSVLAATLLRIISEEDMAGQYEGCIGNDDDASLELWGEGPMGFEGEGSAAGGQPQGDQSQELQLDIESELKLQDPTGLPTVDRRNRDTWQQSEVQLDLDPQQHQPEAQLRLEEWEREVQQQGRDLYDVVREVPRGQQQGVSSGAQQLGLDEWELEVQQQGQDLGLYDAVQDGTEGRDALFAVNSGLGGQSLGAQPGLNARVSKASGLENGASMDVLQRALELLRSVDKMLEAE